jgi:hypothetical protein
MRAVRGGWAFWATYRKVLVIPRNLERLPVAPMPIEPDVYGDDNDSEEIEIDSIPSPDEFLVPSGRS